MLHISSKHLGDDGDLMRVTRDGGDVWTFEADEDWSGCGAGRDHVWVGDRDGTINIFDVALRARSAEVWIPREPGWRSVSSSRDGRLLYVIQSIQKDESSALHVVDLQTGYIIATHAHVPGHATGYPTERSDGELLLLTRRTSVPGTTIVTINPISGECSQATLGDGSSSDAVVASPDGTHLLRRDLTTLPRRSVGGGSRGVFGFGRRGVDDGEVHYGLVWQVWQANPLRFIRRIVAQWMRPEELLDGFYFGSRLPQDEAIRCRTALWDTVSRAMTAAAASPTSGPPAREAYRSPLFDSDEALRLVEESVDGLRTSNVISKFEGWQPDGEAFWVATGNYLTCIGLDGTVSPRLYLERKGLDRTTVLASACPFERVRTLAGRKAEVSYSDGTAVVNGSNSTLIVHAVPLEADGWQAAPPPPPPDPRGNTLVIPIAAWTSAGVEEAIDALCAELTAELFARASDWQVELTFQHEGKTIEEASFFDRVASDFPSAAPALRRLVNRLVEETRNADFLFSDATYGHGFLSHAVLALGLLDPEALPLVRSYGRVVDREHEHDFAGMILPRLIEAHGWTDPMIDFVFWVLIRNYFNTITDYSIVWREWGLRDAAVTRDPILLARHVVEVHRRDLKPGKFAAGRRKGGLTQLGSDIAKPHEPWLADFLAEAKRQIR